MYNERKEKFSFKSFFLTLLLVLLFIFLMLWLFPTKNYVDKKLQSTHDLERLSVLYDEIFANNISRMKDAAIGYFTNERMPKAVGDTKKLTLGEMYELHLILKIKDKDGNYCDETKSYVEMTKYSDEYRLKVNLSCGDQEDYIIVYLGCYNYCSGGICEKRTTKPSPKPVVEEKYTCKVVNGKYYDKNGKVVSKTDYEKSCNPKPEKYTCKVVNGKYYDKNGKVVSKTDYEKSCNPKPEKYTCKVVNGKYYDKNGKVVSKADYEKSCNPIVKTQLYEYKLVVSDSVSCPAWSSWQKEKVTATDLRKVETKTQTEVKEYKTVSVPVTKTEVVKKQVTESYIKEYVTQLVVVDTKRVKTNQTTTKTITEEVIVDYIEVDTGKIDSGFTKPVNTDKEHYKIISTNTVSTCSNCQNKTRYTWKIYSVEPVWDVVEKTVEVPVYKDVKVYQAKEVPVWDIRTVEKEEEVTKTVYETKKVPVYQDVTYYRYQNCTLNKGYTDIKWSEHKVDATLIGKGYKSTGKVKEV